MFLWGLFCVCLGAWGLFSSGLVFKKKKEYGLGRRGDGEYLRAAGEGKA